MAETLKVRDLATLIAGKTGVEIRNLENPRKEDAENELQVCNGSCGIDICTPFFFSDSVIKSWPNHDLQLISILS